MPYYAKKISLLLHTFAKVSIPLFDHFFDRYKKNDAIYAIVWQ